MNRRISAAALLLWGHSAWAAELSPQDFAFGAPIDTAGQAAAYHLALPLAVYQGSFREDLGDLRVFNAHSDAIAHVLLRRAPARAAAVETPLPVFALPAGAHALIAGTRLTIDAPGVVINLQNPAAKAEPAPTSQYILDARALHAPLEALRLDWMQTETAYSGQLRVEASDDLSTWRTIVASAPVVNLRAHDQAIVQNRVSLPATQAHFWRMTWTGTAPSFALTAVIAETSNGPQMVREHLVAAGTADGASSEDILFDLRAHVPVDRVTLLMNDLNTIVKAQLFSRASPRSAWRPMGQIDAYRLSSAGGELVNPPAALDPDRDRYWRIHPVGEAGIAAASLRLQVQWVPDEVIFLAHGPGPFLLAYGSSSATPQESAFDQMPAGIEIAAASVGVPAVLGGSARLSVEPPAFPKRRAVLWSVLVLAVIGLAAMAYRLMKEGPDEEREV